MTWLDVDLKALLDPDRVLGAIAAVLGVERVVPLDSPDPWPFRAIVDHRRAGVMTVVRFLCPEEFDALMPTPLSFAVRLASTLQTDVIIDPAFLPGVGMDTDGWLLVRPSGEGVRVFEAPSDHGDVFMIDERPEVMRSIGQLPG